MDYGMRRAATSVDCSSCFVEALFPRGDLCLSCRKKAHGEIPRFDYVHTLPHISNDLDRFTAV